MIQRVKQILLGKPKDPLDPKVFHQVSLIAFLAWVGLGADGLSSSAYGPEEAYLALGNHFFLALPLAILMAVTVFVISVSYSHIIEAFPTGGGGYLVATKLLGAKIGLVSGSALIVDYMLTITISVASAGDQIFSFLPASIYGIKPSIEFGLIFFLIYLNLRGTKESVIFLLPIFLLFVVAHIFAISLGVIPKGSEIPALATTTYQRTVGDIQGMGLWTTVFLVLHAYSLGGGTYTGIEAVSNGLQALREPRVETGKKTMLYMSTSLAFTASGLLLCYLLNQVAHQPGKTLNASLFEKIYPSFFSSDSAYVLVIVTLVTEAAILLVAAQTGFIDGPRVLSNMAIDSWVPHRFSHLSDHLVTQYGVWFMGLASLGFLLYTGGDVRLLVVMYSINVFLTFSLSQLGMCRHWWEVRDTEKTWVRKFFVNGLGLSFTAIILVFTVIIKFAEGGWVTLLVTSGFILLCYVIRWHYDEVRAALKTLDDTLMQIPFQPDLKSPVPAKDPNAPTAVLIVREFDGLAVHSLLSIGRLFPNHFKNIVFVSIGLIDSGRFKGQSEIENLRRTKEEDLKSFVEFANCLGWYAEYRYSLGVDLIQELVKSCKSVAKDFPKSVFFAGKLVFERENFLARLLHNHTPFTLEQRLQFEGLEMMILPIRVFSSSTPQAIAA
ncbi:MAG TPA: APC family permease [Candidatus Binatia bacterium]|jgi:amino acid transporter|nr:APC family permease [Candidatus Binatia bacterium]